jgi:YD repeat-containing protein
MFLLRLIWAVVHALFAKRADLVAKNLALRQQLIVLHRKTKRPRLKTKDRVFWLWLARSWDGWRESLIVVKPATVVRWHRQGFKYYWAWKSRHKGGRPAIDPEVRDLIRKMSRTNPLWGAPRIHGELLKLGIDLSQTTVAKYMIRRSKGAGRASRLLFLIPRTRNTVVGTEASGRDLVSGRDTGRDKTAAGRSRPSDARGDDGRSTTYVYDADGYRIVHTSSHLGQVRLGL